jgi:hypothetical protein
LNPLGTRQPSTGVAFCPLRALGTLRSDVTNGPRLALGALVALGSGFSGRTGFPLGPLLSLRALDSEIVVSAETVRRHAACQYEHESGEYSDDGGSGPR